MPRFKVYAADFDSGEDIVDYVEAVGENTAVEAIKLRHSPRRLVISELERLDELAPPRPAPPLAPKRTKPPGIVYGLRIVARVTLVLGVAVGGSIVIADFIYAYFMVQQSGVSAVVGLLVVILSILISLLWMALAVGLSMLHDIRTLLHDIRERGESPQASASSRSLHTGE